MDAKEKGKFLPIDGVEELLKRYYEIFEEGEKGKNHAVIVYGDTGCGKKWFCNECMRIGKERNEDIIEIDMLKSLKALKYSSEEKLKRVLEIMEYELINGGGFDELRGMSATPHIFMRQLEKMLGQMNKVLLIRLPKIEVFEEIDKYYQCLFIRNTIIYFITEKRDLVKRCREELDTDIRYFECKPLKKGDGKLIIENIFSGQGSPRFQVEDVESYMANRPPENGVTVKELTRMCTLAFGYAKKKNIKCITKSVIFDAMTNNNMI